jgi:hypothetical protein
MLVAAGSRDLVEELFTINLKGQRIIRWSKKLAGNPEVRPLDLSDGRSGFTR